MDLSSASDFSSGSKSIRPTVQTGTAEKETFDDNSVKLAMALKTYLLPPNFTTHPDGPLRIGNIITDPFRPMKAISEASTTPQTLCHRQAFSSESSNGSSLNGSIWANFVEIASAKIGGGVSKDSFSNYGAEHLDTIYLKKDPTDDEGAARAKEPRVEAAMASGSFGRRPVYMITGLKIARQFSATIGKNREVRGEVGGSGAVAEGVSIGADISGNRSRGQEISTTAFPGESNDIVFAYQLHTIAWKGFRKAQISVDVFAHKAGLLSRKESSEEFEAPGTTQEDLKAVADENEDEIVVRETKGNDGEDCVCFALA